MNCTLCVAHNPAATLQIKNQLVSYPFHTADCCLSNWKNIGAKMTLGVCIWKSWKVLCKILNDQFTCDSRLQDLTLWTPSLVSKRVSVLKASSNSMAALRKNLQYQGYLWCHRAAVINSTLLAFKETSTAPIVIHHWEFTTDNSLAKSTGILTLEFALLVHPILRLQARKLCLLLPFSLRSLLYLHCLG